MLSKLSKSVAFVVVATLAAATAAAAVMPGDQSRWSLDFRARLEQINARAVEVHLVGDWISTVVAKRAGEYDAQLQADHLQFTGDTKSVPAEAVEKLRKRLSQPFWVTYRSDGGMVAIHFKREVIPSDQNLLQMIATELQFVSPGQRRESWTAQERDGAGEYLALYVAAQPDRILKRKLKYLYTDGVAGAPADRFGVAIDQASATFNLDANGNVRSVDDISRMRMDLSADHASQIVAVTEIHLANARTAQAPELVGSLERALPTVVSSAIQTHQEDPRVARAVSDDRLLEGHTTASLLAAAFANQADDLTLPDRLAAMFRRRPEAPGAAIVALKKNGAQKRVTDALGIAESPAAIGALATLAGDKELGDDLRVDAILAFLQMQNPTVEAMRVPVSFIHDPNGKVRGAARFLSGTVAHTGRSAHPAEANSIDAALITVYRGTDDPNEQGELLGALGNSAGPKAVAVIEEALGSPRAPVRAAAARALRLVTGAEVDELLAKTMMSDMEAEVRTSAIFAARFRHPLPAALADALMTAASHDKVDYVRSEAIALLRQNPTASPLIPEALSRVAEEDANAGIRRQARNALASTNNAASR